MRKGVVTFYQGHSTGSPVVALSVKRACRFSKGTRFPRFFFTLSQQVSLEITKALSVSRGTVCASPLSVAATGTALSLDTLR